MYNELINDEIIENALKNNEIIVAEIRMGDEYHPYLSIPMTFLVLNGKEPEWNVFYSVHYKKIEDFENMNGYDDIIRLERIITLGPGIKGKDNLPNKNLRNIFVSESGDQDFMGDNLTQYLDPSNIEVLKYLIKENYGDRKYKLLEGELK